MSSRNLCFLEAYMLIHSFLFIFIDFEGFRGVAGQKVRHPVAACGTEVVSPLETFASCSHTYLMLDMLLRLFILAVSVAFLIRILCILCMVLAMESFPMSVSLH